MINRLASTIWSADKPQKLDIMSCSDYQTRFHRHKAVWRAETFTSKPIQFRSRTIFRDRGEEARIARIFDRKYVTALGTILAVASSDKWSDAPRRQCTSRRASACEFDASLKSATLRVVNARLGETCNSEMTPLPRNCSPCRNQQICRQ